MAHLTVYRQARVDGGVRTGLELNEVRGPERFDEGPPELADEPLGSGLLWYIDIDCEGDAIPSEPEACRRWLIEQRSIVDGLRRLSEELPAGWDDEEFPIRWADFRGAPAGASFRLSMSAMRRVDARRLSGALREFANHWVEILKSLEPFVPVQL